MSTETQCDVDILRLTRDSCIYLMLAQYCTALIIVKVVKHVSNVTTVLLTLFEQRIHKIYNIFNEIFMHIIDDVNNHLYTQLITNEIFI
jgi:hypothetical protein